MRRATVIGSVSLILACGGAGDGTGAAPDDGAAGNELDGGEVGVGPEGGATTIGPEGGRVDSDDGLASLVIPQVQLPPFLPPGEPVVASIVLMAHENTMADSAETELDGHFADDTWMFVLPPQ